MGSKAIKKCSPVGEFYSSVIDDVLADSRELNDDDETSHIFDQDILDHLELLWRAKLMIANPDKVYKKKLTRINIEIPISTGAAAVRSIPIVIPLSAVADFHEVLSLPNVAASFTLPPEQIPSGLQNQLNIHFCLEEKEKGDDGNSVASTSPKKIKKSKTKTTASKISVSTKSIKMLSISKNKKKTKKTEDFFVVDESDESKEEEKDESEEEESDESDSDDFDGDDESSEEKKGKGKTTKTKKKQVDKPKLKKKRVDKPKEKKEQVVIVPTSSNRVTRSQRRNVNYNLDGANDSDSDDFDKSDVSQSEDCNDDDDDDDDEATLKIEEEVVADDPNEKPIDSEDDPTTDTDEDATNEDEANKNLVICQYQKVTRKKNMFKMELKSGVMTLKGKDYVFGSMEANAEWY